MLDQANDEREARRKRWGKRIALLIVIGLVLAVVAFFFLIESNPLKNVTVVVDNDLDVPVTLRQEDDELVVGPRSCGRMQFASGLRRITIVANERTIFDEEKRLSANKKYLVNPGATQGYASYVHEYSTSFDFLRSSNDPKARYRDLLKESQAITFVDPAQWHELSVDYLMEAPPALIKVDAKKGPSRRSVTWRMRKEFRDVLLESRNKRPDEPVDPAFVERLERAVGSMTFSASGFEVKRK